jgi:hypothetical protein
MDRYQESTYTIFSLNYIEFQKIFSVSDVYVLFRLCYVRPLPLHTLS